MAYYSAALGAWINTRMELDKTLIALAFAAIALIGSLITGLSVVNFWHLAIYGLSGFCFAVSGAAAYMAMYVSTSLFLASALDDRAETAKLNKEADKWDKMARLPLAPALACFLIAATWSGIGKVSSNIAASRAPVNIERPQQQKVPISSAKGRNVDKPKMIHQEPKVPMTEPRPRQDQSAGGIDKWKPTPPPSGGDGGQTPSSAPQTPQTPASDSKE